jgi:hypothetical protein
MFTERLNTGMDLVPADTLERLVRLVLTADEEVRAAAAKH